VVESHRSRERRHGRLRRKPEEKLIGPAPGVLADRDRGIRPRIRGSGSGSLLALCRPVLAIADGASSIAPIGVQLVEYVLHLLNGTGRPARGAGCPHRNRRRSGAGRPPWLWPPGRSPERNRGHRRHKDNGQRNVRRHQILHYALPQVWTALAAILPCRLDRSAPGAYDAMDSDGGRRPPDR